MYFNNELNIQNALIIVPEKPLWGGNNKVCMYDHVTDEVMPLFWSLQTLSGRTLLCYNFSLPCDKKSTLHSPQPSFPTFSLMFIVPFNFKCRTSTGYFEMPQTTKTSKMLIIFNSIMTPFHSNEKS